MILLYRITHNYSTVLKVMAVANVADHGINQTNELLLVNA